MHADDIEQAKRLAEMPDEQLGSSEEDVKLNFVVPLLELLGHSRLRFEHKHKDILLRDGLPPGTTVVVETKRLGEPLDRHLGQLSRYSSEERSVLSLLTNGDELRVYAPMWPQAPSFAHTHLCTVRRAELAQPPRLFELVGLLGAEALANGRSAQRVEREKHRREKLWKEADSIRRAAQQRRKRLEAELRDVDERLAALEGDRKRLHDDLATVASDERGALAKLHACYGIAPIAPPPSATGRAASRPQRASLPAHEPQFDHEPAEWPELELRDEATEMQRLILATMVRAGRRSMGTQEIVRAAGLKARRLGGSITGFTGLTNRGLRDTLLEVTRPPYRDQKRLGVIVTIAEKYWPIIQRLYADAKEEGSDA